MESKQQSELAPHRDAAFRSYPDDEISLIDLAKILIKRRWWLLGFFIASVFTAVTYVLAQTVEEPHPEAKPVYQYTTYLAVGYKTPLLFIEPLPSVATQIQEAFLPFTQQKVERFQEFGVRIAYEERGRANEEVSNLLELVTLGSEADQQDIADFHQQLLAPLIERHQRLVDLLANQPETASQDQQLLPSEIAALATQKRYTPVKEVNGQLILALGIVLGGILGVMAAFFAEFVARVRLSLKEEAS